MKIILVVFLLSNYSSYTPLYYTEYTNMEACEKAAAAVKPQNGFYPVKKGFCVEFKKGEEK